MLVLVLAGAAALVLLSGGGGPVALSFAQLQSSGVARQFGLDNTIPPELRARARGLAIVCGELAVLGLVMTSAYRSPMVNAALYFVERNPGQTPDIARLSPRATTHSNATTADFGVGSSGLPVAEIRARLTASRFASIVTNRDPAGLGLNEGDHLHVDFAAAALTALDDGVRT